MAINGTIKVTAINANALNAANSLPAAGMHVASCVPCAPVPCLVEPHVADNSVAAVLIVIRGEALTQHTHLTAAAAAAMSYSSVI
jgi:hypothetical protein